MTYVVSGVLTLIASAIYFYVGLPVLNIQANSFWVFLIFISIAFYLFTGSIQVTSAIKRLIRKDWQQVQPSKPKVRPMKLLLIPVGLFVIYLFAGLYGSPILHAHRYASLITVENGDWDADMPAVETVDNIALMDTATAEVFGERALGSLSDIVSQYDLSDYTQINLKGKPMKVSPLHYESFWKWVANRENGIPGYVLIDPVNNSAQYVKLDEAMKYSPYDYFNRNALRAIRLRHPTAIVENLYFEIDEEGHPYWVAPAGKPQIGLFGGTVIDRVILLDAVTGESQIMPAEETPEWVDVVFDGDYICQRLDWYGELSNGFLNSMFSKTGCKRCTDDFGYVTKGSDIWVYTGITSVAGDSSNIGVVLCNERTCEVRYYSISGADEHSAMGAAEGEVQQYSYLASFPSIINVNGEPTYIMVLKDNNSIVKEYAMVNVANYSKVVVAETQEEVFAAYAKKMGFEQLAEKAETAVEESSNEKLDLMDAEITVQWMQYIVTGGETTVYIKDVEDKLYKIAFTEDCLLIGEGDSIKIAYEKSKEEAAIIPLHSLTKS